MSGAASERPGRTIVKVCGLTRLDDAHDAREAGADWLGFIVHGDSPRRVRPEYMSNVMTTLPGMIGVAVMVGVTPDEALALAQRADAKRVQVHGVHPEMWPADFPIPTTVSVPVAADGTLTAALPDPAHLVMLDSAHPKLAGGTGHVFPWEAARVVARTRPVVLAGGLSGDNVAAALERVRPFGVDASSRLESEPGIKDLDRVRAFVAAVREWDAAHAGA
jgi:phosphoribosylanthranilate isomerase